MSLRRVFALLTFSLALTATALGQSDRGSITGTVKDPSGGLVANAKVTAVNTETNETREATTSDEGSFTIPELKAGPYKVTVEAQGFKTTTAENVQVAVQVARTLDVNLEIGAVGETVTVTSDAAPVIQTESAVRQTNVTERQVKELPLLVGSEFAGRTPLSFIFLDSNVTAGAANAGGGSGTNSTNFRVSGGQALGTEILIDGASTRRTQNGTFFSEIAPGPNAFQEFTVSTSTFSAEFGNSSGGIVNFTQRSGSNEFHGEAYDLIRNEKLNANTYLNNAAGRFGPNDQEVRTGQAKVGDLKLPRNRDNQNDFGFNIGGPVVFPHFGEGGPIAHNLRNKAFFFFNYEGYRFKQGANTIITVPTLKMRQGDFSELLTDPYILQFFGHGIRIYDPRQPSNVRQPFANNIIPVAQQDIAGRNILQFFPLPNTTGPNGSTVFRNYRSSGIQPTDMNQFTTKLDVVVSDKQRITGSLFRRKNDRIALQGGPIPRFPLPFTSQGAFNQLFKSTVIRLQHDYTFSPKLLNHFNVGFTRYDVANRNTTDPFNTSSLGIPANATQNSAFPRIDFPGYGEPSTATDPRAYQNIGSTFFTDHIYDTSWHLADALTYVTGRHTLKFGADVRPSQFNFRQRIDPGGTFNFRHDQTAADSDGDGGWPIASLITGATEFSFNSTNSVDPAFRQLTQGYFAQDDFKVTQRLTLNVGLRYDLPGQRTESRNFYRGFDPNAPNPEAGGRRGAIAGAGGQGGVQAINRALVRPDRTNWGPRIGAAYSYNNRTVLRGGIGIYYAPIIYGFEGSNDLSTGLLGYNTGSGPRTPDGRNAQFFLSSYPSIPAVCPTCQFLNSDVQYLDPNFKTGRTVQYSLDVQRELPYNFALSVGYVGHHATRLRSNFQRLNALPLNALRLGYPILTMSLTDALANTDVVNYARTVGVTLPASNNAVYPGFGGNVAQALRPFPQYNRINNLLESQGTSDYNALQVKLDRRFTRGIQFGASYTFSKLITNASEDLFGGSPLGGVLQNPFDVSSFRSVSPNNAPHVLVINYLFELPFGKGRHWLNQGGIVDKLIGGWQLNGIQRYQSGTPLSFFTSDPRYTDFTNLTGYLGNIRLNATGQPFTINSRALAVPGGVSNGQQYNLAAVALPPEFGSGLNRNPSGAAVGTAAYANYYANPLRFFGSLAPSLSQVHGPRFYSEDISLLKKTHVTEAATFELGAEFFNVFNRTHYFFPTTDFRQDNLGTNGTAGFQSVGAGDPRRIQIRLRLLF